MRFLVCAFFCMYLPFAFSQAHWNNTSFVHRDGGVIRDGQDNIIRLEGVNLGGWLMWEGWIWGGGFTQEKTMYQRIESKVGPAAAAQFRTDVHWQYITEEDIELIGDECFNIVRIPFNHTLLEDDANPFVYKASGWEVLDSILSWCEQNNVYALLDLHGAPGGQSNSFTADPDNTNLWESTANQTRTAALWKAIANRYKNRGIIAGYDLLNEPDSPNDAAMVLLYERIADSIRTVDNNHMLFIEGNNYASDFSMFSLPIDPNMVYEFHFYTWFMGADFTDDLQTYTDLANTSGIPVWCGEWGETNYSDLETVLTLFRDDTYAVRGSAFWTWKKVKKAGQQPFYNGVDSTLNWNKSITWVSNPFAPTPTPAEMQSGIVDFLHNSDLTYCTFNNTINNFMRGCGWLTSADLMKQAPMLYPNPFTDVLFVSGTDTPVEVRFFDEAGRFVYRGYASANASITTNQLPRGLYFYQLYAGDVLLQTGKLIAR